MVILSGCGQFNSNEINTAIDACKNNGGVEKLMFDVGHRFVVCNNSAKIELSIYNKENKQ